MVLKVERDGRVFYIKTDLPLTSRRMRLPTFLVSGSGVNHDGARVSTQRRFLDFSTLAAHFLPSFEVISFYRM